MLRQKWTLEKARELAAKRGGEFLSDTFKKVADKYLWRCKNKHEWHATLANVSRGQWCFLDRKQRRRPIIWTVEMCKKLAKKRNGQFLSNSVDKKNDKYLWKCENGHEWVTTLTAIENGQWCMKERALPKGKKPWTLERCKKLAKKNNGEFLSDKFLSLQVKHTWRCKNGHEWETTPNTVEQGRWCPKAERKPRGTIKQFHEIAKKRGGKCLSKIYNGHMGKYEFKCANDHTWKTTGTIVTMGSWCPYCSSGRGEKMTRKALEIILGYKLPPARPKWLKIKKIGRGLELDGYNEENKVAFEYDGMQHYYHNSWFFENKEEHNDQIKRDKEKNKICKNKRINLIRIKQHKRLHPEKVFEKVLAQVIKAGIKPKIIKPSAQHIKNITLELKTKKKAT